MTTRLKFPLDPAAVRKADEAFYAQHPEMVEGGRRRKLTADDPAEAPLREEWRQLYGQSGGAAHQPPAPGTKATADHDRMRESVDKGFSRVRPVVETVQHCAIPVAASTLPVQYDRPCNLIELVVTEHCCEAGTRTVRYVPNPAMARTGAMVLPPGGVFAMVSSNAAASEGARVSFDAKGKGFCGVAPHPSISISGFPAALGKAKREVTVHAETVPQATEGLFQLLLAAWSLMNRFISHEFSVQSCGLPAGTDEPAASIHGQLAVYPADSFNLTLKSFSSWEGSYDSRKKKKWDSDPDTREFKLTHNQNGIVTTVDFANYLDIIDTIEENVNNISEIFKKNKWVPGPRLQGSIAIMNGNVEVDWYYTEPDDHPEVILTVQGTAGINIIESELIFSIIITPYPLTAIECGVQITGAVGFQDEFAWGIRRPSNEALKPYIVAEPHGKIEISLFLAGYVGFVSAVAEGNGELKMESKLEFGLNDRPFHFSAKNCRIEFTDITISIDLLICEKGYEHELKEKSIKVFDNISFPSSS